MYIWCFNNNVGIAHEMSSDPHVDSQK